MKILIATKNPGKIEGAKLAFERYFDNINIQGIAVDSEVPDEPVNDEIYKGVSNRVKNLKKYANKNNIKADFYIAVESGITDKLGEWLNINLALIENDKDRQSLGMSQAFPIPKRYIEPIKNKSLGTVMDEIFSSNELSKGNGGISLLTHGEITRIDLTRNAFIMALTQYINKEIW